MKIRGFVFMTMFLILPQLSHATSCADIFEKAKHVGKGPNGKAPCILQEHNVGIGRGSSESVYLCGGTRYILSTNEDYECKVTTGHK
jgi:hypothetical protein